MCIIAQKPVDSHKKGGRENEKTMLLVLAHELLHHNIIKKFKGPRELHMYMEPILNKIIKDLPLDLKENLKKLNEKIREKYDY